MTSWPHDPCLFPHSQNSNLTYKARTTFNIHMSSVTSLRPHNPISDTAEKQAYRYFSLNFWLVFHPYYMLYALLTSCLVDCSGSLLCTLMELCTQENRQHENRMIHLLQYYCSRCKDQKAIGQEPLERKSTCQLIFFYEHVSFYCTH